MNHPNESGKLQYDEVVPRPAWRYRLRARIRRLAANVDGLIWYLRHR